MKAVINVKTQQVKSIYYRYDAFSTEVLQFCLMLKTVDFDVGEMFPLPKTLMS